MSGFLISFRMYTCVWRKKSATVSSLINLNKPQNKVWGGGRNLITDQLHVGLYVDFKVTNFQIYLFISMFLCNLIFQRNLVSFLFAALLSCAGGQMIELTTTSNSDPELIWR